jgi:uncharacterized protein (DUF1810 family)
MTEADRFHLERFVSAQEPVFETVLAELRSDRKRSHWMWFIFPQLLGLGRSSTARFYGIRSIDEAPAYLAQPHCQLKRPWYARRVGGVAARVGELLCSRIMLPRSSRAGRKKAPRVR